MTSRKTDFRKLKKTLVTMAYHSQHPQCPSLLPHVLLLRLKSSVLASIAFIHTTIIIHVDLYLLLSDFHQGGRKDGRGNEPVGSCATCDARSTGPTAHERVEAKLYNT